MRAIQGYLNPPERVRYGLLLSGGGARASYQAGVLRYIADAFPETTFPIITGVSAGAINAAHLASRGGSFRDNTQRLVDSWREITPAQVYSAASNLSFLRQYLFGRGSDTGKGFHRALLDTQPLREYLMDKVGDDEGFLRGVQDQLSSGALEALAVLTTNYGTGQTVTWVQGSDIKDWERPSRVGISARLTVEHIMASTALPVIFPAIRIGDAFFGDGGVRLAAPLAPVVHLGANRVLAISTRYARSRAEADTPSVQGYPPLGQIASLLMNSVFLDSLDQDAHTMDRINALLAQLPLRKRLSLRPIKLLVLRPSRDLGKLAGEYQSSVTGPMKLIARLLGARTNSPDWLSMLLFEEPYVRKLVETGYNDGHAQRDRIEDFFAESQVSRFADNG